MAEFADWIGALVESEGATLAGVGNIGLLALLITRFERVKISWSAVFMMSVFMVFILLGLALSMFLVHLQQLS